ncbi:MAG: hypothetical protein ABEK59_02865 [Halobacteria archaeon]
MTNKTEETLHIPAEEIPSGSFSVDIREPTFKDRLEANKRVPENSNMGYSIPQLMLSRCITKLNNQKVNFTPKDPICNIKPMSTKDQQFLIAVFNGAFYLDDEMVEDVKSLANELREDDKKESFHIPATRTPSETLSVTFRVPTTGQQIELDRRYPGNSQTVGYSFEEFFFANLLTHVNGKELSAKDDGLDYMMEWKNIDAEYCVATFLQMNFIDRETREKANELGKKWRKQKGGTKRTSKSQEDTTDSQQ